MLLRNSIIASAIVLGLQVPLALASESTNMDTTYPITKGELERLHINNLVLQAQVQGAQLSRQLAENRGEVSPAHQASVTGDVGYTTLPGGTSRPVINNARAVVLEITGRDKNLKATLQLPSGQTLIVSNGSKIAGTELTVKNISLSGVLLSDGSLLTF